MRLIKLLEAFTISDLMAKQKRDDWRVDQHTGEVAYHFDRTGLTSLEGIPPHLDADFDCSDNKIASLEHGPRTVIGSFYCNGNMLRSLEHGPHEVSKTYNCSDNMLMSLVGAPANLHQEIFNCSSNELTNLKGCPKKTAKFIANHNFINTLEDGPTEVTDMYVQHNRLTSLAGAPSTIGKLNCSHNQLTSLQGIHKHIKVANEINFIQNPIKSHVLGLLKIKGLQVAMFSDDKLDSIINKYLPEGNMFDCQAELEDAGLEEYAQL